MIVAAGVFAVALLLIMILFAVKYREEKTGRVIAPDFRHRADLGALELKEYMLRAGSNASKIPPRALLITRYFVHEAALAFARIARSLERQAHNVADMVSHKRGFERKESRSEFLKQVSDHKNGNGAEGEDDDMIVN